MSSKWLLRLAYLLPTAGVILAFLYYGGDGDLSSDSNLYLFVGNNFWSGSGLLDLEGDLFAAHGPIFPLLYSLLYSLAGAEIIQTLIFLSLGFSFLIAIYLSQEIFSARSAFFAALLFLATPFFWHELDKGSVDYLQLLLVLLFFLTLMKATRERFIVAGLIFALMLLSKETMALMILAPLAWLGEKETRVILKRYLLFLLTAFLAAGWWWLVVWNELGVFFPMQQLEEAYGKNTRSPEEIIFPLLFLLALLPFALLYWQKAKARLLLFLMLASIPPTALALANNMDERQFIIFSLLGSIVLAAVIDGSLKRIKRENLSFALSLLPLFLLLLFPWNLLGQNPNVIRSGNPYISGVLKKEIKDNRNLVFVHSAETIDLRQIARQAEKAFFLKSELENCPCGADALERSRFYEKLRRSDYLLVLKDKSFLEKPLPGLELIWRGEDNSAIFRIKKESLLKKTFYKLYRNN